MFIINRPWKIMMASWCMSLPLIAVTVLVAAPPDSYIGKEWLWWVKTIGFIVSAVSIGYRYPQNRIEETIRLAMKHDEGEE